MSDAEERADQGYFDEQDGQECCEVEQDQASLASEEEFQERQSIEDEEETEDRASSYEEREARGGASFEDEKRSGDRASIEDEKHIPDPEHLEDEEDSRDRESFKNEEECCEVQQDQASLASEEEFQERQSIEDEEEIGDRTSPYEEREAQDGASLGDEKKARDRASIEDEEYIRDRENLEDETRDRERLEGKQNTRHHISLQDEEENQNRGSLEYKEETRDRAYREDKKEKDVDQADTAEGAEATHGCAENEKEELQEDFEEFQFKTSGLEKEEKQHDCEGNESDERNLKASEFEAPASFIIHDSVSANNHGNQSYGNRLGAASKIFDTQDSYETGSKRDEVFHDDNEASKEYESRKKLDQAMIDKFRPPSTTETSEAVVVKDVPSGTVSEKLEKFQEKLKSSQSPVSSHPAVISSHGGKLRDGRIEMFEMLKNNTRETEAKTRPTIDVSVVSKGRANEIKEKIEQGKLTARDGEVSSTDGPASHESTLPAHGTRKKIADEWMTRIKSANQTNPEARVHASPPQATNVSAIKDNFWKKREETLNNSLDRQSDQTEEGKPALTVGKLKLKEKEAIFGGAGDKIQSSDSNAAAKDRGSSEVKRTPSYTYRSYRGENGSSNTPNVVSFTKSGVVKTDTRVELSAKSSNGFKNDPYRAVDRQGLIKTIENLKKRIEELESENENLKNSLKTTHWNDDDDGGNDDNNNSNTIPEPTKYVHGADCHDSLKLEDPQLRCNYRYDEDA